VTAKFRPIQFNPLFTLKSPYKVGKYNWRKRTGWSINGYLLKVHNQLHYKSSHAPYPVRKKWKKITDIFIKKHHKIL
jgi:hypothetical protein